jgi:CSLREA domain-containing protein
MTLFHFSRGTPGFGPLRFYTRRDSAGGKCARAAFREHARHRTPADLNRRFFALGAALVLVLSRHVDGATFNVPAGDVTQLKAAINFANTNGEDDVINLGGGSYAFSERDNFSSNALPAVQSDGGKSLIINGNNSTIFRSGSADFRILDVRPSATVTLNALRIENGQLNNGGTGAGIRNDGAKLTLVDCTIANNRATQVSDQVYGGGIFNAGGVLELRRCTLRNNSVEATIGDPVTRIAGGGAIYNSNGTVHVQLCTFAVNIAKSGGAIENSASFGGTARLLVSNSTFSDNQAPGGGAINSRADGTSSATTTAGSSILTGPAPQLARTGGAITSAGYNLTNGDGGGFLNAPGDQMNTDPQLRPLATNGGPTQTHELAVTSPAIDAGKRDAVPVLAATTDQRSAPRPFAFPGATAAPGGDRSDIGSFEKTLPSLVVTTTADHDDGNCTAADCTLREAVNTANANPEGASIAFASGVTGTIQLSSGLPQIAKLVSINGPGANLLTVRRNTSSSYRIFLISNNTVNGPTVEIGGLTIANGRSSGGSFPLGSGGGILSSYSNLTVSDCVIAGNVAPGFPSYGGGIFNYEGTLVVNNSSLTGNSAFYGGGIANYRDASGKASVTVNNSTLSGNTVAGNGGALFNNATNTNTTVAEASFTNCTLAGNQSSGAFGGNGGAIYNIGTSSAIGRVIVISCTFDNNSASASGGGISNIADGGTATIALQNSIFKSGASGANLANSAGNITSLGHNLSSDNGGAFLTASGDQINTDPQFDPAGLANNGGSTMTIALQPVSPAVDKGSATALPRKLLTDQRGAGFPRTLDNPAVAPASAGDNTDIGAYELPVASPTPTPTATPAPTATPVPNRFANISTRLRVETGDNVLIGGFIVTGSMEKRIIVRALGPSLPGEVGPLANPLLELYDANAQLVAANDNWGEAPNRQEIIDSTIPPPNELESAILQNVKLGAHTVIVRDVAGGEGVGLVEAYDIGNSQNSKLANISTRGRVLAGDNVMIGGLIITGSTPQKVILRAIGPSLRIGGQLEDPFLELFDSQGNPLASNNNWKDTQQQEIEATTIPPADDRESAIVTTLAPSAYTAVVRGAGETTGVALVEAYALD